MAAFSDTSGTSAGSAVCRAPSSWGRNTARYTSSRVLSTGFSPAAAWPTAENTSRTSMFRSSTARSWERRPSSWPGRISFTATSTTNIPPQATSWRSHRRSLALSASASRRDEIRAPLLFRPAHGAFPRFRFACRGAMSVPPFLPLLQSMKALSAI